MATSYKSAEVKCPYYKYDKERTIKCEGVMPDSNSINTFIKHEYKNKQMEVFCKGDYTKCEHYAAVTKSKYPT